jgi:hypothetical protein
MVKNTISPDLLEAVMARKVLHSCLNLISLYSHILTLNKHCTFAEKLTVNKLKKFTDNILSNILKFAKNKKGYSVETHAKNVDSQTDFLIELLTLSEMLVDNPESRIKVIKRFEHLVGEENKRFFKVKSEIKN